MLSHQVVDELIDPNKDQLFLVEGAANRGWDSCKQCDILIVGFGFWKKVSRKQQVLLDKMPSILIVNK